MPKLIAAFLAVLGVILFLRTLSAWIKVKKRLANGVIPGEEVPKRKLTLTVVMNEYADIVSIALIMSYAFLLRPLGYLLDSFLYLTLQMTVLSVRETRNKKLMAVVAVAAPVIIYYVFTRGLTLMLPRGVLYF
jgi:hypothetical protein